MHHSELEPWGFAEGLMDGRQEEGSQLYPGQAGGRWGG